MLISQVWDLLGWDSYLSGLPRIDAASWLLAAWDVVPSGQHSLLATILWLLWNARNSAIFGGVAL